MENADGTLRENADDAGESRTHARSDDVDESGRESSVVPESCPSGAVAADTKASDTVTYSPKKGSGVSSGSTSSAFAAPDTRANGAGDEHDKKRARTAPGMSTTRSARERRRG